MRKRGARARLGQAAAAVRVAFAGAATTVHSRATHVAEGLVAAVKDAADRSVSGAATAAGGLAAHGALTDFAKNLDFRTIDPTKYRYAGTRGITLRSLDEARLVWESIPEQLRALGPEEVGKRLQDSDWSHILPQSQGGGNEASNGIFERASLNRSRGAERMTAKEIQAAQQVLSEQAFRAALVETASRVFRGAAIAAAVGCVLSALEHGLEYQRGEITRDELYQRIGRAVAMSAASGGAVAGLMTGVALAFPALIPLAAPLMMPLAVLGFCTAGVKIVRLGKGWYEFYQQRFRSRVPTGIEYQGYDIVPVLIERNDRMFAAPNVRFDHIHYQRPLDLRRGRPRGPPSPTARGGVVSMTTTSTLLFGQRVESSAASAQEPRPRGGFLR